MTDDVSTLPSVGVPVRSKRAGIRRNILKSLRAAAETLRHLISVWNSDRKSWVGSEYHRDENGRRVPWRWRRLDEFPENDPAILSYTANRLRSLANGFYQLAQDIDNQAVELRRPEYLKQLERLAKEAGYVRPDA